MIFRICALAIMAVFYGCYFLKKSLQGRRGIRTNQIGQDKTGFPLFVELIMGVVTLITPIAGLASIWLGRSAASLWMRIAGVFLGVLGTALFLAAMLTMGDSWRAGVTKDKTSLVTTGIFRHSRNPAFLGFDLVYLGVLLIFPSWPLCLLSLFAILTLHLQIVNNEEDAMLLTFGEEYLEYKKQVNRYWGRK